MNDRALIAGENSKYELLRANHAILPLKNLVAHSLPLSRNDGVIMGLAIFVFTTTYAIVRYDKSLSGKEPHVNIPMYLVDKAIAWTALWMMVVSPFAGNLLTLNSIYQKWSNIGNLQKIVRRKSLNCLTRTIKLTLALPLRHSI